MECDFLEASPRPRIQWFMNNGTFPIAEEMDQDEVLFVEEGRFLFIRVLTAHQRNSSFHCEVVNAFLGTQPQRSPITYTLGGDIPPNDLEIYIGDRSVTAIIGEPVRVVYAAARSSPGTNHVTCSYPGVEIVVTSGVVVTFTVSDELRQPLNLNCSVLVDVVFTTVMYTFKIARKCVGFMGSMHYKSGGKTLKWYYFVWVCQNSASSGLAWSTMAMTGAGPGGRGPEVWTPFCVYFLQLPREKLMVGPPPPPQWRI